MAELGLQLLLETPRRRADVDGLPDLVDRLAPEQGQGCRDFVVRELLSEELEVCFELLGLCGLHLRLDVVEAVQRLSHRGEDDIPVRRPLLGLWLAARMPDGAELLRVVPPLIRRLLLLS